MRILGIILILSVVGFFGVHMILEDKMESIPESKPDTVIAIDKTDSSHAHKSDLEVMPVDKSITKDDAEIIAMENENLNPNGIYNLHTKKTNYHGIDVYEVEFEAKGAEIEYNIEISTGEIISREYEIDERYYNKFQGSSITEEDIFKIIKSAIPNVKSKDIYYRLKNKNGYDQYEGYANVDNFRYEFVIDKRTGTVVEWKWERITNK